jgi:hypothetical protein
MPYRVLIYQQRIWAAILRDEPHRKTLPPVITLVIHGEGGWRAPRTPHQMIEGLDEAPALSPFVPDLELLIDDLSAADNEALFARPLAPFPKVVLWLLRDGREIEILLEHLPAWARSSSGSPPPTPARTSALSCAIFSGSPVRRRSRSSGSTSSTSHRPWSSPWRPPQSS